MENRSSKRRWSRREETYLRQRWGDHARETALAKLPGRSWTAICEKAERLGLGAPTQGHVRVREAARMLGYDAATVRRIARDMGLSLGESVGKPHNTRELRRQKVCTHRHLDYDAMVAAMPVYLDTVTISPFAKEYGEGRNDLGLRLRLREHLVGFEIRSHEQVRVPSGFAHWLLGVERGRLSPSTELRERLLWQETLRVTASFGPWTAAPWAILAAVHAALDARSCDEALPRWMHEGPTSLRAQALAGVRRYFDAWMGEGERCLELLTDKPTWRTAFQPWEARASTRRLLSGRLDHPE